MPSSARCGCRRRSDPQHRAAASACSRRRSIEIAAGDIGRARSATDELEQIAARFESKRWSPAPPSPEAECASPRRRGRGGAVLLRGGATLERGRRRTRRRWHVAEPRRRPPAAGSEHRAVLERDAARTILREIEAAPPEVPPRPPSTNGARRGGGELERLPSRGDYWTVLFAGHTVRVRRHEGHALPVSAPRRSRPGAPRAGPRRRRDGLARGATATDRPDRHARHSAMPARCSTRLATPTPAPRRDRRRHRAGAPSGTPSGRRRPMRNAISSSGSSRAFGLGGRERRAASASRRARAR